MAEKINGAASASQTIAGAVEFYIMYCQSPLCVTFPNANPHGIEQITRKVNIYTTKNVRDQSQKNFEIILMAIGLRAMPDLFSDPVAVLDLSQYTLLNGEGFMWKFASTKNLVYGTQDNRVKFLEDEVDGIVLNSGVLIDTKTVNKNVIFATEIY